MTPCVETGVPTRDDVPCAARTVVVCGATGTVGRRVAHGLAGRTGELRVLTRDPRRAAAEGIPGRAVGVDFADRGTLGPALQGADALLVVTADPLRPDHDENILAAARERGVRHVVKLSALAVTDPAADDLVTRWQRRNEDLLRSCGLSWTLLRPRAFMTHALGWAASVRSERVVRALHGDSKNACIDPADIAAVAVRTLTEPGHEGRTYALTGPEPISAREQTEQLAQALGHPLRFVELTVEQARAQWRRRWPEPMVQALVDSARRQRDGAKARVESGVREVTGRPPRSFRAWAAAHTSLFRLAPPGADGEAGHDGEPNEKGPS